MRETAGLVDIREGGREKVSYREKLNWWHALSSPLKCSGPSYTHIYVLYAFLSDIYLLPTYVFINRWIGLIKILPDRDGSMTKNGT